jgi:hypothetical protein
MGIFKGGKVVIMLAGRFAGRKAVVVKATDDGNADRRFGNAVGEQRVATSTAARYHRRDCFAGNCLVYWVCLLDELARRPAGRPASWPGWFYRLAWSVIGLSADQTSQPVCRSTTS